MPRNNVKTRPGGRTRLKRHASADWLTGTRVKSLLVSTFEFLKARRNPLKHAEVLLKETSLHFDEIAEITGLNIYEVVGIKLKLRKAA